LTFDGYAEHMHDHIISLRGEVCANKTSSNIVNCHWSARIKLWKCGVMHIIMCCGVDFVQLVWFFIIF